MTIFLANFHVLLGELKLKSAFSFVLRGANHCELVKQ